MKYSDGFSRLVPTAVGLAFGAASFYLMTLSLRSLPVGTAYAVWTGIGAAGTVLVGVAFIGEPATAGRLLSVALVISGIIGLKLYES